MPFHRIIPAGLTAFLLSSALILPTATQTAAELFDDATLHEIRLSINSRDLRLLREHYQENTYYRADLQWRGSNVAVRSRGGGSRNPGSWGSEWISIGTPQARRCSV